MNLPRLYIKEDKEKALYNKHLWIFSGAIGRTDPVEEGNIVQIHDANGQLAGYGFYVNGPSIKVKIFEHTNRQIDVLGYEYWRQKIFNAFKIRKNLFNITNAYRLIYAEGDFFPGLIIDVYDKIAVIQTYNRAIDHIFDHIKNSLYDLGYEHIYVKKTAQGSNIQLGWIDKPTDSQIIITEYGIKFLIDIEQGQKTGFYLDQRYNRKLVELYSRDKYVLNLFSYTGGFSLYALYAGAKLVHSVDQSQSAIQLAKQNVLLNHFDDQRHETFTQDCFDFVDNSPNNFYDLIIVDPPAFAKSKKSIPNALRGYKEINKKVFKKIKPGGIVFTFSCSQRVEPMLFRKTIFSAAAETGRKIRIIHQLTQDIDHPINIFHPETEYLKGLALYVE